jgi:O-antigen/teichoic acid export membrane protein
MSFGTIVVITTVTAIITSRLFGITVVGQFALVMGPYALLSLISTVQERTALSRTLATISPTLPRSAALFWVVYVFSFALTAIVSIPVGLAAAYYLSHVVNQPWLVPPMWLTLLGYVFLDNTSWNLDAVFGAYRAGRQMFVARVVQAAFVLGGSIAMALVTRSVWGLVLPYVASFAVALAVRLAFIQSTMRLSTTRGEIRAARRDLRSMIRFGVRLVPGSLANAISIQAPIWILGALLPIATVGAWSRAYGLAQRLQELFYRVNEVLMPTLSARHGSTGYTLSLSRSLRTVGPFVTMIATVGAGAANSIMAMFGPGFALASDALRILLFAFAIAGMASMLGAALIAEGRPTAATSSSVVRAVVSVALIFPFAQTWGLSGAAAALLIGAVAQGVMQSVQIGTSGFRRENGSRVILATGIGGAAGWLTSWAVTQVLPGAVGVLLGLAAGCLAFLVGFGIAGGVRDIDEHLLGGPGALRQAGSRLYRGPRR